MDAEMRTRMSLLRDKYGNSFINVCIQAKREFAKQRDVPFESVRLDEVIGYLWNREGDSAIVEK